jgi:hypothetical protein
MNRAILACICILVLCSAAGLAQAPSEAPFSLAAILNQPALSPTSSDSCANSQSAVLFDPMGATGRPGLEKAACSATANCGSDGFVNCTGSYDCSVVDRNCPTEQGHVTCDGVTTWCPACNCSTNWCCICSNTANCAACCRCEGGSFLYCTATCGE